MKFSYQWLQSYFSQNISIKNLIEQLTAGGFEVTSVVKSKPIIDNVVIGKIYSFIQHPKNVKLYIYQVLVSSNKKIPIIIVIQ